MLGCGCRTALQIHTAQVARKLALTAAATKGGANQRKQAAAAAAGALESPLNGATAAAGKRKAGAAAQDGFQLPGLGADGKLTAALGLVELQSSYHWSLVLLGTLLAQQRTGRAWRCWQACSSWSVMHPLVLLCKNAVVLSG
jgi:hypothetical protein